MLGKQWEVHYNNKSLNDNKICEHNLINLFTKIFQH